MSRDSCPGLWLQSPSAVSFTRLPHLRSQFKNCNTGNQGRKLSIWLWSKHQKGKKDKNKEKEGRYNRGQGRHLGTAFTKIEEQLNCCLPKWSGLTHLHPWLLCFISLNAWLWMGRFAICLNNNFLFFMNWAAVSRTIKASFPLPSLSVGTLICRTIVPPPHWHPLPATISLLSYLTFPPEVNLPGQDAGYTGMNAHSEKNRRQIRNSSSTLLLGNPRVTDVTSCEI